MTSKCKTCIHDENMHFKVGCCEVAHYRNKTFCPCEKFIPSEDDYWTPKREFLEWEQKQLEKKGCCIDVHSHAPCGTKILCPSCSKSSEDNGKLVAASGDNSPLGKIQPAESGDTQTLSDKITHMTDMNMEFYYAEDVKDFISQLKFNLGPYSNWREIGASIDKLAGDKLHG